MNPGRDPFLEDEPESAEWRVTGLDKCGHRFTAKVHAKSYAQARAIAKPWRLRYLDITSMDLLPEEGEDQ